MSMLSYFTQFEEKAFKEYFLKLWGTEERTPAMTVAGEKVLNEAWEEYQLIKDRVLSNKVLFNFYSSNAHLVGNYLFDEQDEKFKKIETNDSFYEDYKEHLKCTIYSLNPKESAPSINTFQSFNLFHWRKLNPNITDFVPYGTWLICEISNTQSVKNIVEIIGTNSKENNGYSPYFGNNPILLSTAKGWNHHCNQNLEETQKKIILALLEAKNLDVNAVDLKNGMSALHIACLRGDDPELIKLLLDKGADPLLKDSKGRTPVELLQVSYSEAIAFIEKYTGGNLMLMKKNRISQVTSLVAGTASLLSQNTRENNIKAIGSLLNSYQPENKSNLLRL